MEPQTSMLCPVCSLYLREGISLKSHLQTHSKDKVIEALLNKQIGLDGAALCSSETDTLASVIRDSSSSSISLSSENRVTSYSHSTLSILPTPTYVQPANPSPSLSGFNCNQSTIPASMQYMPALGNNVIAATQTMLGNTYQSNLTYQQFITNDGNIVLIPVYTSPPAPPMMVSNNLLSPPVINSCIMVPPAAATSNVGSVTVVDTPAARVPHHRESPKLISSPSCCVTLMENCTDHVHRVDEDDDDIDEITLQECQTNQPLVSQLVAKDPTDDYEKENDAEVASIFKIPASSIVDQQEQKQLATTNVDESVQSTSQDVLVDLEDIDDKSSCYSYDKLDEDRRNNYSVVDSPFSSNNYENEREDDDENDDDDDDDDDNEARPSKSSSSISPDISIIKLHTELNYESENSENYTPEPTEDSGCSAGDVLKSDEGESDKSEHSYVKDYCKSPVPMMVDSKTYTSPIHSPAPMENSHLQRSGQFDFIVSNSDNATHILPDRLDDELGPSTSKNCEKEHYILPNNEIPRTSPVNVDYSFIGLRSSFSTSASLISSVNKTMFADVDVYAVEKNEENYFEKCENDNATNFSKDDFYASQQQRQQAHYAKMNVTTEEKIRENYKGFNELLLDSAASSRISPFDIQTDESMPARGELSGQESLSGTENSMWESQVQQQNAYVQRCNISCKKESSDVKIGLQTLMAEINIKVDAETFRTVECDSVDEDSKLVVQKLCKKKLSREFRCFYCKENFESWKSRQLHIANVHADEDGLTIESLFGKKVKREREDAGEPCSSYSVAKTETDAVNEDYSTDLTTSTETTQCRICSENFETSILFLDHLKNMHGIKKRNCVCPTCLVHFTNVEEYQEHIQKVHPYECMTCGKKFHTRPGYMLHQKRHMKVKPYGCHVCDKSFVTKQKLGEHINIHTGDNPIKCDMCDSVFKRYSNYQQHKKYLHMNTKRKLKDFICDCGEVFHSKTKLLWHREIHDEKPKQCPFCVERFVHTASLTRHVRKWHNETYLSELVDKKKIKNVVCPVCNITYLHTSLQTHMKIHEGIKPFSCGECSKTFRTKWNLQLHRWTHMSRSSKPYKCKLCVKAYIHKTDYEAHLRSHSNCRPYSCNVCGRQFIRKYNCIRHMREHKEPKAHKCNLCKKMFSRSYYLTEHYKTHTLEKPHTCHVCGKTSATKSNHNKHVKMHNNIRESVNSEI